MPFLCFSKVAKELKSTFSYKETACKFLPFSSSSLKEKDALKLLPNS